MQSRNQSTEKNKKEIEELSKYPNIKIYLDVADKVGNFE